MLTTIKATYTGAPSMGFVTGKKYVLEVIIRDGTTMMAVRNVVSPYQQCPYGSWPRFLDFWSNVTKENPRP